MQTDRRRRQWLPLSATYPHGHTPRLLKERFGRDGLLVWVLFLAACKRSSIQGEFEFVSEFHGWCLLGLEPDDLPAFSLADFFRYTGELHLTRKRRSGDVVTITARTWDEWQTEPSREFAAARMSRKRAQDARNSRSHDPGTDLDLDLDHDKDQKERALRAPSDGRSDRERPGDSATTRELVAHFVDSAREAGVDVPQRVAGHLAREVKNLLDEGQPPTAVARGLDRMLERRIINASLLPGMVVEAGLPKASANGSRVDRIREAGAAHAAQVGGSS